MNGRSAARIRARLTETFPGVAVTVSPDPDGARITIEHGDDLFIRVTTGDKPGPVVRAMLGRDLRAVDPADS